MMHCALDSAVLNSKHDFSWLCVRQRTPAKPSSVSRMPTSQHASLWVVAAVSCPPAAPPLSPSPGKYRAQSCLQVFKQLQALPSPPGRLPAVQPAPSASRDQRPAPVCRMVSSAMCPGQGRPSASLYTCASAASSKGSSELRCCSLADSSRHCAMVAWQALRASSPSKRTLPAWRPV